MSKKESFILWFKDIGIEDVELVGGKNAALGEMFSQLTPLGLNIPNGFALTASAYRYFLEKTGLEEQIKKILTNLDTHNIKNLQEKGKAVRNLILAKDLPPDLKKGNY